MANPLVSHIQLGNQLLDISDANLKNVNDINRIVGAGSTLNAKTIIAYDNTESLQGFAKNSTNYFTSHGNLNSGTTSEIVKYDLTGKRVSAYTGNMGHTGSICFDSNGFLLVPQGAGSALLYRINVTNMTLNSSFTVSGITRIDGIFSYNGTVYLYFDNGNINLYTLSGSSATFVTQFADAKLTSQLDQALCMDDKYYYHAVSHPNAIYVYNRSDGNLFNIMNLDNMNSNMTVIGELEDIEVDDNILYIASNTSGVTPIDLVQTVEMPTTGAASPVSLAGIIDVVVSVDPDNFDNMTSFATVQAAIEKIRSQKPGKYTIQLPEDASISNNINLDDFTDKIIAVDGNGSTLNGWIRICNCIGVSIRNCTLNMASGLYNNVAKINITGNYILNTHIFINSDVTFSGSAASSAYCIYTIPNTPCFMILNCSFSGGAEDNGIRIGKGYVDVQNVVGTPRLFRNGGTVESNGGYTITPAGAVGGGMTYRVFQSGAINSTGLALNVPSGVTGYAYGTKLFIRTAAGVYTEFPIGEANTGSISNGLSGSTVLNYRLQRTSSTGFTLYCTNGSDTLQYWGVY